MRHDCAADRLHRHETLYCVHERDGERERERRRNNEQSVCHTQRAHFDIDEYYIEWRRYDTTRHTIKIKFVYSFLSRIFIASAWNRIEAAFWYWCSIKSLRRCENVCTFLVSCVKEQTGNAYPVYPDPPVSNKVNLCLCACISLHLTWVNQMRRGDDLDSWNLCSN